jgi:hypothetical protein
LRWGYALAHGRNISKHDISNIHVVHFGIRTRSSWTLINGAKVELDLNKRSSGIRGSYHGANARGGVHVTPLLLGHGDLQKHE